MQKVWKSVRDKPSLRIKSLACWILTLSGTLTEIVFTSILLSSLTGALLLQENLKHE